jgi:hypothetical protein
VTLSPWDAAHSPAHSVATQLPRACWVGSVPDLAASFSVVHASPNSDAQVSTLERIEAHVESPQQASIVVWQRSARHAPQSVVIP